jgi:hypothetical protein
VKVQTGYLLRFDCAAFFSILFMLIARGRLASTIGAVAGGRLWQSIKSKAAALILAGLLVCYFLLRTDIGIFELDQQLPKPIVDFRSANAVNDYSMRSLTSPALTSLPLPLLPFLRIPATPAAAFSTASVTFIVRTYGRFVQRNVTTRLLDNLAAQTPYAHTPELAHSVKGDRLEQAQGNDAGLSSVPVVVPVPIPISTVIVSTDADSVPTLQAAVAEKWQKLYPGLDVHYHAAPAEVYRDNCCQVSEMCTGSHSAEWLKVAHSRSVYGRYKDVDKKIRTACAGNNLLHYALTDLALRYALGQCSHACDTRFVVVTNGDNEYRPRFVSSVVGRMLAEPAIDVLMVDYLERGEQLVRVGTEGNAMDLGCMVFRISALQRLAATFLTPLQLQLNAWPHHYYGADNVFLKYLHEQRGAKVGFLEDRDRQGQGQGQGQPEVLFVHW